MTNNEDLAKKIDRAVFTGQQGGPLMHVIAAKAIAFEEALRPEFKHYQQQILNNTKAMAEHFKKLGYKVVSDGTENHLFILDVYKTLGINGLDAQTILEQVNITCNKNNVPFDEQPPKLGSGIRLGTAAMTTRGLKETDMILIAELIHEALTNHKNEIVLKEVKEKVLQIIENRPLFVPMD
jgi:glycine hydroxymethyltransferase